VEHLLSEKQAECILRADCWKTSTFEVV